MSRYIIIYRCMYINKRKCTFIQHTLMVINATLTQQGLVCPGVGQTASMCTFHPHAFYHHCLFTKYIYNSRSKIKFSNVGLSSPFTLPQSSIASFTLLERSAFQFPQRMLVYLFISQHSDILLLNNMWVTLKLFYSLERIGNILYIFANV